MQFLREALGWNKENKAWADLVSLERPNCHGFGKIVFLTIPFENDKVFSPVRFPKASFSRTETFCYIIYKCAYIVH